LKNVIITKLAVLVLCLGGYFVYDKMLDKDVLSNNNNEETNEPEKTEVKEYVVGDKIVFNNQNWYVIANSSSNMDYVTVINESNQVDQFAYSNSNNSNYDSSDLKVYLEQTYMKELGESNLKLVNGYKIRAITKEELVSLGCETGLESNNIYEDGNCASAPSWLKGLYWTMSPNEKMQGHAWYVNSHGYGAELANNSGVGSTYGVRAVINLLKSSID